MTLTLEYLKKILRYEPETGYWFWLQSRGRAIEGNRAGSYSALGYLYIKIDGQSYIGARLAWLYMKGEWPKEEVDHIDRMPGNDAWDNLREANRAQNVSNRGLRSDNVSGAIGVRPYHNKWKVEVNRTYLGLYDTLEEAVQVRNAYAIKLQGKFAVLTNNE